MDLEFKLEKRMYAGQKEKICIMVRKPGDDYWFAGQIEVANDGQLEFHVCTACHPIPNGRLRIGGDR